VTAAGSEHENSDSDDEIATHDGPPNGWTVRLHRWE
jgi:hypothetical protein